MTEPLNQKSTESSENNVDKSYPLVLAGLVILAIIFAPFLLVLGILVAIGALAEE
jgi:uncharacterized protein (UPF0333 family)